MAADAPERFEVAPPGKAPRLFLLALGVGAPLALLGGLAAAGARDWHDAWPAWLAAALLATVLGIAMRRRSVSIERGQLVVRAAMYTLRVPLSELDRSQARVVDLAERTEFTPRLKTNAFAMPGFRVGHFRAGRIRAGLQLRLFCLLTDGRRVLVLPERDGRHLLLSLVRPQALLDALSRAQRAGPRPRGERSPPARPARRSGGSSR